MLRFIRSIVLAVIDFFHRPFRRVFDAQTFRYLFCGVSNVGVDWVMYLIAYFLLLHERPLHWGEHVIGLQVAASCMAFFVSFPFGFLMSRYIVFPESTLRGRVQLFRYALTVAMCFLLTYLFIKMYSGFFEFPVFRGWDRRVKDFIAKFLTTATVAIFSYFAQRHFTFKVMPDDLEPVVKPKSR